MGVDIGVVLQEQAHHLGRAPHGRLRQGRLIVIRDDIGVRTQSQQLRDDVIIGVRRAGFDERRLPIAVADIDIAMPLPASSVG